MAPELAKRGDTVAKLMTRRHGIVDEDDHPTRAVDAFDEALRPVWPTPSPDQDAGQPGHLGQHGGDRETAELETAQDLGMRGEQGGHELRESAKQGRRGRQPVGVEMVARGARGAIADGPVDPAARLDRARQGDDVGIRRLHAQILPSVR